jgi:hypothetical protein
VNEWIMVVGNSVGERSFWLIVSIVILLTFHAILTCERSREPKSRFSSGRQTLPAAAAVRQLDRWAADAWGRHGLFRFGAFVAACDRCPPIPELVLFLPLNSRSVLQDDINAKNSAAPWQIEKNRQVLH